MKLVQNQISESTLYNSSNYCRLQSGKSREGLGRRRDVFLSMVFMKLLSRSLFHFDARNALYIALRSVHSSTMDNGHWTFPSFRAFPRENELVLT